MTSPLFPDPLQFWRDALTKLEGDTNARLTDSLKSEEVLRWLHQATTASLGTQKVFEKVTDAYLRRANLPSRKDVVEIAEALRRIEDKLDLLLPVGPQDALEPKPARTRRPAAAPAHAEPDAAADKKAGPNQATAVAAKRSRRGTRAAKE